MLNNLLFYLQRGLLEDMKVYLPRANVLATKLDENNGDKVSGISDNLARKRGKLTYAAVQNIHSIAKDSDDEAKTATECGLWHTLVKRINIYNWS